MKHLSLLTLALCALVSTSFAQYSLTVDTATAVDPALGTTYSFYINLEDATDQVSAVFGNNQATLEVNAPDGVYNSAFNASWNASGINPVFLTVSPELAADTYATIGLTGPASTSGIAGAADPAFVEDPLQPMVPFFQNDGETSLLCNTQIGSSWYVLNTAANASPQDDDLRVLVMQVTSTGPVTGQIPYQVFPLAVGDSVEKYTTPFDGPGTWQGELFVEIQGCMVSTACNYNPDANLQPIGICNLPDECGNCDGDQTGPGIPDGACDCDGNTFDDCGVCGGDNSSCEGCAQSFACNYDPAVPFAANNDDLCVIPDLDNGCGCAQDMDGNNTGELVGDEDGDGICDAIDLCTDVNACNYDDPANEECAMLDECGICGGDGIAEGACDCDGNVEDAIGVCGGDCTADEDMDGICDDQDVCTDTTACNYDFDPTEICLYLDVLDSCGGNCFAADSTGMCIELIMYGCTDSLACNYDAMANTSDDSCLGENDACDDGDDSTINDTYDADCGCVGEPVVDGCTDPLACNYDEDANMDDGSCLGSGDACDDGDDSTINDTYDADCGCAGEPIVNGCTDPLACNYNEDANQDDGSCEELDALGECGGDCFADNDGDGECDETIMEGCTNDMACNYDEMANTDDGSCLVIGEACDDMDDMTFDDIVNDSCECVGTLIVLGCLDSTACNYDMDANTDSEMCEFPGDACDDDDVNTINDTLGVDCICVGVDTSSTFVFEFERLEFGMFPNPTTGEVTLRVDGFHAGVTMQVMDGAGRVVWSEQNLALQGNTVFDLSRLSAGTYNVMLSDERGISVKRLAIQK
jgi:hypothetical protein